MKNLTMILTVIGQIDVTKVLGLILPILIYLAILFGLFLLLRELFCWYWKINQMISLQNEIIASTHLMTNKLDAQIKIQEKMLKSLNKDNEKTNGGTLQDKENELTTN